MDLSDKTALVTGATGGLGHAIARALRARRANLVLTGRRREVLEPLAEEVSGRLLEADLSNMEQALRVVEEAGDIDVFVANAGIPGSGTLESFGREEIDRALDVNLRAPMLMTHAMLPGLIERGQGHFVYMSSISGKVAIAGTSVYSATKFGLRGFAQALREDLRKTDIGVSAIFPGPINDAGMWADTDQALPRYVGTRSPEDVANAVIRAIDRNRAEINVNPPGMALGPYIGAVAPQLVLALNRLGGGNEISAETAKRQLEKR